MFDGIMLSGDDYIAHYLILIKPAKNDIVEGRECSPISLPTLLLLQPISKAFQAVLGLFCDAYMVFVSARHNAFLRRLHLICNLCKLSLGKM